jgi:hypothetical protein
MFTLLQSQCCGATGVIVTSDKVKYRCYKLSLSSELELLQSELIAASIIRPYIVYCANVLVKNSSERSREVHTLCECTSEVIRVSF